MQQESPDELDGLYGDRHGFVCFSILCVEGHHPVIKGCDAAVSNGYPMSVTGNVFNNPVGFCDGLPDTDHPFMGVQFSFKRQVTIFEAEFAALNSATQIVDELAAKDQRQGLLIEQVIFFARDPLFTVF